jgi:hypothetical protein
VSGCRELLNFSESFGGARLCVDCLRMPSSPLPEAVQHTSQSALNLNQTSICTLPY